MTTGQHYKKLEHLYHQANVQEIFSGSTITVRYGQAEIIMPVNPKFFHGGQALHGAAFFKLLDDAAYFAVASVVKDVFIVTSSFQLNLLRPVSTGTMRAVGTLRSTGTKLYIAESVIYNEKGKEVAFGTGQFMKTNQKWDSLLGYH